jgi:predicted NUDIX family NTP pyrophosphohydrolase
VNPTGTAATPHSAGVLLYRRARRIEVLLAHPGGPYWSGRDAGAWQIPKGAVCAGEEPLTCAIREFEEETGARLAGTPWPLATIRQAGGKRVAVFALEGELDPAALASNMFALEWPPRSGQLAEFPEVDELRWFTLDEAAAKILPSQAPLLGLLEQAVRVRA